MIYDRIFSCDQRAQSFDCAIIVVIWIVVVVFDDDFEEIFMDS